MSRSWLCEMVGCRKIPVGHKKLRPIHRRGGRKKETAKGGDLHPLFDHPCLITRYVLICGGIMHKVNIDPWFVQKAKQTRDGRLHVYDTLEARKTALVVVDMQNYQRAGKR